MIRLILLCVVCLLTQIHAEPISDYALPSYRLTPIQSAQWSRDSVISAFWSAWDGSRSMECIDMIPAKSAWVNGSNSFTGKSDAECEVRSAYDSLALYLMFKITDNTFMGQFEGLGLFLDKLPSQQIRDAAVNPYDLYLQSSWGWTLTYYTIQYQINMGSGTALLPSFLMANYYSGSAMMYNRVNLTQLPTVYPGMDIDAGKRDDHTRLIEWRIPWAWVGNGGGLEHEPAVGTLSAMSVQYNDDDSPLQTGRKTLTWKEKDPFNTCTDYPVPHQFCDSWGDILFTGQPLDTVGFAISSPSSVDVWVGGTLKTIRWTTRGMIANVKIDFTADDSLWSVVVPSVSNSGSYAWTVPAGIQSRSCRIRLSDPADSMHMTQSALFSISGHQSLSVTVPNGGEAWASLTQYQVRWTTGGIIPVVKIEYTADSGLTWLPVSASVPNTGVFVWLLPNALSRNAGIRISDTVAGGAADASDSFFSITTPPSITLLSPNGGEIWAAGTIHPITWTTSGSVSVLHLAYSTDGTIWRDIVAVASNTGSYSWTVPNTPSAACRIKIGHPVNPIPLDTSDAPFTISQDPAAIFLPDQNMHEIPKADIVGAIHCDRYSGMVTIPIGLSENGKLSMDIFSVNGKFVYRIDVGTTPAGYYHIKWDGRDNNGQPVRIGVYLVKVLAGDKRLQKTFALTR